MPARNNLPSQTRPSTRVAPALTKPAPKLDEAARAANFEAVRSRLRRLVALHDTTAF
jgi:hypothetical protein